MPLLQVAWPHSGPSKCHQGKMQLEQEEQLLAARMSGQENERALCGARPFDNEHGGWIDDNRN